MSCLFKKLWSLVILAVVAQANASPLFDEDIVLDVELTGPLGSLIANKKERTEAPFVLRVNGVAHNVTVRVRGKSRIRVCNFLPLRINFSGDDTSGTVFEGQDKLKLVTQCRKPARARTNTLEEFAAYRIFNRISDVSYKVRLLHVKYTNTDGRVDDSLLEQYGFLIESDTGLAERLGAESVEVEAVTRHSLNEEQAAAVYVFQYLIGNTDWSLVTADGDDKCCHNGDLFKMQSGLFYVPYDFDLAGLVDASYAYPDPALRIRRVTQRRYRGYCTSSEVLKTALRTIKAHRFAILEVLSEIPGLAQKDVDANVKFLEQFFTRAEDEAKLLRSFEKQCL